MLKFLLQYFSVTPYLFLPKDMEFYRKKEVLEKENSEDLGKELFIQGICFNEILFEIFHVGWNLILSVVLGYFL